MLFLFRSIMFPASSWHARNMLENAQDSKETAMNSIGTTFVPSQDKSGTCGDDREHGESNIRSRGQETVRIDGEFMEHANHPVWKCSKNGWKHQDRSAMGRKGI